MLLNGRLDRTAADYYMIHEYAGMEFGGLAGIEDALNVSVRSRRRRKQAVNNLSPLESGCHATQSAAPGMTLEEQRGYVASLLLRWIKLY